MDEELKPGCLVFLTKSYDEYFHKRHPEAKISLVNRIARLEEIIDWGSSKGQKIKQARVLSGKWKDLPIEENKYILSVYYHELIGRKGQRGVAERGVSMFRFHPQTKEAFFEKIPDWIYIEIMKKCEEFKIEDQEVAPTLKEQVEKYSSAESISTDGAVIKALSKKKRKK
jgi:hypothetical protein